MKFLAFPTYDLATLAYGWSCFTRYLANYCSGNSIELTRFQWRSFLIHFGSSWKFGQPHYFSRGISYSFVYSSIELFVILVIYHYCGVSFVWRWANDFQFCRSFRNIQSSLLDRLLLVEIKDLPHIQRSTSFPEQERGTTRQRNPMTGKLPISFLSNQLVEQLKKRVTSKRSLRKKNIFTGDYYECEVCYYRFRYFQVLTNNKNRTWRKKELGKLSST